MGKLNESRTCSTGREQSRNTKKDMNAFVELSADAFLPESSCHHYLSMAQNFIVNFKNGKEVKVKFYLYSIRTIFYAVSG
jgi:predicted nucleotidyltransferase